MRHVNENLTAKLKFYYSGSDYRKCSGVIYTLDSNDVTDPPPLPNKRQNISTFYKSTELIRNMQNIIL